MESIVGMEKFRSKAIFISRIILVFLGFIGAIFLLEIILRNPRFESLTPVPSMAYKYHPYYRITHQPYFRDRAKSPEFNVSWNFNSLGFRDIEHSKVKKEEVVRLAFIGDSFTIAYGVEVGQRFSDIVEEKLNKNSSSGQRYESLNFSFPGWGTGEYEAVYKHLVSVYSPDYLFIGFFIGNDALDAVYYDYHRKYYFLRGIPDTVIPSASDRFLTKYSFLYRFILNRYYNLVERTRPDMAEILFGGDVEGRMLFETQIEPEGNPEMIRSWDLMRKNLMNIKKLAERNNTRVILIIIPGRENVIPDFWKTQKRLGHNIDERIYTRSKAYEFTVNLAKEIGIEYIDILEKIKNRPDVGKMYFTEDFHFSFLGHQVVGETIYEKIFNH